MSGLEALTNAIYHEKQQPGEMLCAQHALNAVLQGSYFTAPDLSSIAHQLDDEELVHNPERGQKSENMDDTGFFSIQVVTRALDAFGLTLVPWRSEALRPDHDRPGNQRAFVLNHEQHWFTLRRFGFGAKGHWYNLNSMLSGPEWLSGTYLGMFIQQAEEEGYSVFAVRPADLSDQVELPRTEADNLAAAMPEPSAAHRSAARLRMQSGSSGLSTPGTGAHSPSSVSVAPTAAPLADLEGQNETDWMADEDMELQAALQASLMAGGDEDQEPWGGVGESSHTTLPAHSEPTPTVPSAPRTRSANLPVPGSFPDDDIEEDDQLGISHAGLQEIMAAEREARDLEAAGDAVGAGMARSRAMLARFEREQAAAVRAMDHIRAQETPQVREARERRQRETEEEEEMMRRAIEESVAIAGSSGSGGNANRDQAMEVERGTAISGFADEDAELQAALKASLESTPADYEAPSELVSVVAPGAVQRRQVQRADSHTSMKSAETYATESEHAPEEGAAPVLPPEESMEEMRRKRLARFGA